MKPFSGALHIQGNSKKAWLMHFCLHFSQTISSTTYHYRASFSQTSAIPREAALELGSRTREAGGISHAWLGGRAEAEERKRHVLLQGGDSPFSMPALYMPPLHSKASLQLYTASPQDMRAGTLCTPPYLHLWKEGGGRRMSFGGTSLYLSRHENFIN